MQKRASALWIVLLGLWLIVPLGAQTAGSGESVERTLATGNVYIDPALGSEVDAAALQQATMNGQDTPHTQAKIAMLKALPQGFVDNVRRQEQTNPQFRAKVRGHERELYTVELDKALNLGKNALVVVVTSGPGAGVSVWTDGLDEAGRIRLAQQYAPQIVANPTRGTAALAQAVTGSVNNAEYKQTGGLWAVFLLIVIVVAVLIIMASRKRKGEMIVMRGPIDGLRANVLQGIEYLDNYMDVLPKNNPDSDAVRMARQSAVARYDNATKILDHASAQSDLQRAQELLDRAQADVGTARTALDRALGNTAAIPGDDALRPPPLPQSESEVQAIPSKQRGASFFSSQPAPLSSLVPVTITIDGHSKQVLATPEEADELRQGRMPQVRAFNVGGQQVPWYAYNQYDPYNDYWRYQRGGWGGFGNGAVAGFLGAELLGGLLSPGYGYGGYGSPYAFDTGSSYYQGYADAQSNDNFGGFDAGGSGGDFFNGNDANINDAQDFDTSGSGAGDFFGGGDFGGGGGDNGGGGDFGGGGGDF